MSLTGPKENNEFVDVARDAASQDGTNIVPIVTYASDTTVQVVTVQPNQEDTMASINVVPVMANPSTDSPVVLSEITVVPLDSSAFQNTEVPVVTDSSATSTASVEAGMFLKIPNQKFMSDVARDAPVEPSLSSATFAPVPVVNNGEELVSSMALPFGNITILQTIHITLSANQTAGAHSPNNTAPFR